MRGGIWLASSGSTGNEMLPPLLLVRFILPFEAVVGAIPILLLLYTRRSQTNNGESWDAMQNVVFAINCV